MKRFSFRRWACAALSLCILLSAPATALPEGADGAAPSPGTATPVATVAAAEPAAESTAAPAATSTVVPTATSTSAPTITPTSAPTATSTIAPAATPTVVPTVTPTSAPTITPTSAPTVTSTVAPSPTAGAEPVIVGFVETAQALSFAVDYGTAEEELGLPEALTALLSDGAQVPVEVVWTCVSDGLGGTAYVPEHVHPLEAVYTFAATLAGDLPCEAALPTATVTYRTPLLMAANAQDALKVYLVTFSRDKNDNLQVATVAYGTPLDGVISQLPYQLYVWYYDEDGVEQYKQVTVTSWQAGGYDPNATDPVHRVYYFRPDGLEATDGSALDLSEVLDDDSKNFAMRVSFDTEVDELPWLSFADGNCHFDPTTNIYYIEGFVRSYAAPSQGTHIMLESGAELGIYTAYPESVTISAVSRGTASDRTGIFVVGGSASLTLDSVTFRSVYYVVASDGGTLNLKAGQNYTSSNIQLETGATLNGNGAVIGSGAEILSTYGAATIDNLTMNGCRFGYNSETLARNVFIQDATDISRMGGGAGFAAGSSVTVSDDLFAKILNAYDNLWDLEGELDLRHVYYHQDALEFEPQFDLDSGAYSGLALNVASVAFDDTKAAFDALHAGDTATFRFKGSSDDACVSIEGDMLKQYTVEPLPVRLEYPEASFAYNGTNALANATLSDGYFISFYDEDSPLILSNSLEGITLSGVPGDGAGTNVLEVFWQADGSAGSRHVGGYSDSLTVSGVGSDYSVRVAAIHIFIGTRQLSGVHAALSNVMHP